RLASNLRLGASDWRDGPVMEHGQARADLPNGGRLRASARRNSWSRWKGPHRARCRVQLGCGRGLEKIARRLFEEPLRTETRCASRCGERTTSGLGRSKE